MHQKKILARSKYVKAVREAELAWKDSGLEEAKEAGAETESEAEAETDSVMGTDAGNGAMLPASDDEGIIPIEEEKDGKLEQKKKPKSFGGLKRLVLVKTSSTRGIAKYVKGVKQSQEQYEELVKQENRTIQQVQLLENMILEAQQKIGRAHV